MLLAAAKASVPAVSAARGWQSVDPADRSVAGSPSSHTSCVLASRAPGRCSRSGCTGRRRAAACSGRPWRAAAHSWTRRPWCLGTRRTSSTSPVWTPRQPRRRTAGLRAFAPVPLQSQSEARRCPQATGDCCSGGHLRTFAMAAWCLGMPWSRARDAVASDTSCRRESIAVGPVDPGIVLTQRVAKSHRPSAGGMEKTSQGCTCGLLRNRSSRRPTSSSATGPAPLSPSVDHGSSRRNPARPCCG